MDRSLLIALSLVAALVSGVPNAYAGATGSATTSHDVSSVTPSSSAADEKPYVDKHTETNYGPWEIVEGTCTFKCVDPHAACTQSEEVLETMKEYIKAASRSDFATCAKYMDAGCTTFDDATKELIVGRDAVLEHLKASLKKYAAKDDPLLTYVIEHPYAKVTGDVAVVTFTATKSFGGTEHQVLKSRCTDVYKKEDGLWKKTYYRSNWKPVETAAAPPAKGT